ncbi:fatty acid hydroxylase superfamily-domain-containing protein [Dipodascopsis tothii]|uniref:fatty acid hydroxylase superfamily-domain-containing protein n=1 Tax=Dipodascopsis tothii TaxID=44089 RepID=UPI0034CE58CC
MSNSTLTEAWAKAPAVHELRVQGQLVDGVDDKYLALFLPVAAYWLFSLMFHYIDTHGLLAKYRIHTPEELVKRNKVTLHEVIRDVIVQQVIQSIIGIALTYADPPDLVGNEEYEIWQLAMRLRAFGVTPPVARVLYYIGVPTAKILFAFFLLDTWQYFLHRLMHVNKTLYRMFHSRHHRLYVPYAFGALYNHWFEGLSMDTVGAGLAFKLAGLSTRESLVFFTFSTLKTVDDHCGYALPFDPLQIFFSNNARYHDIHHQSFGIKTNFSQPFFIHWDKWLGTQYKGRPAAPAAEKKAN